MKRRNFLYLSENLRATGECVLVCRRWTGVSSFRRVVTPSREKLHPKNNGKNYNTDKSLPVNQIFLYSVYNYSKLYSLGEQTIP